MNKYDSIQYFIYQSEGIIIRGLICIGTIMFLIQFIKSKVKK